MICCKNGKTELIFDDDMGILYSLKDYKREYVKERVSIFKLACRNNDGKQTIFESNEMNLEGSNPCEKGFDCTYSASGIEVKISCDVSKEITWGIEVQTPDDLVCEWVKYPLIVVDNDFSEHGGESKVLWGFNEGVIIDNIKRREDCIPYHEPQYPGEGLYGVYPAVVETQFMAYYNNAGGLYFAAHDRDDYLKGIGFYPYNNGVMLEFIHYCGGEFGEKYHMNYPMVMEFFTGDWYTAAEIYRSWFEEVEKPGFVPIEKNDKLPQWYGESPIVVTYPVRGLHDMDEMNPNKLYPYINAMQHVEKLEKELDSKIMVILMHWEGSAPWAPPYVWPPFGGEDELKKFVDALHERGDVIGVYCSGMGWTQQSNLVKEYNKEKEFADKKLERFMCKSPEQELLYSHICRGQRVGYDMCPTQDFTVSVLKEEAKKIAASGVDYIQLLDQNHGGNSYFCYSKDHGHPPVPGKWQTDAVKNLLGEVASEVDNKVLLGCESAAAESYIPYLLFSDNRYNLNYAIGYPVPAYSYVFHRYLNNFMGNQVSTAFDHEKSPENIYVRIAYSFMAGDMLTLVINQDGEIIWNWGTRLTTIPNQEGIKEFVKNLNRWRKGYGKKYLHTGEMRRPYNVVCDKNVLLLNNGCELSLDKVFTSAWHTNDGEFGQFLINYNSTEVECVVELPTKDFWLYRGSSDRNLIHGGNSKVKISPFSAVLLESM